jgi:long-chain acyl-CoA synthetase
MTAETHSGFQRIEDTLFVRARRTPDKTAIVDGDRAATYHDLAAAAVTLSHRLLEQGLQPGDRVSIFLDKSIESAFAMYGV